MIRKVKKFDGGGVARFGTSLSGRMPRSGNYAELPSSGSTLGTTAFGSFRNSPQGKKWAAEVEGIRSEREPREQVMSSKGSVDSDDGVESRDEQTPLRRSGFEKTAKEAFKKGGMAKGGKWIQSAIKKPGALRAQLGVKGDKPIPAGKLAKAAKAPGKLGQRARLAQTLKKIK